MGKGSLRNPYFQWKEENSRLSGSLYVRLCGRRPQIGDENSKNMDSMDCQTFVISLHRFSTFSLHILLSLFSDRMAMNVLNNQILSVKNLLANVGDVRDVGSIPGSRRSPGEGHGNPLQFSCLENLIAEEPGGLQSMGLQGVRHD